MKLSRFAKNQWFRVVTQGVHFFATAHQIREGVGDHGLTNASIQQALEAFERTRSGNDLGAIARGIAGCWHERQVQLDIMDAR